MIYEDDLKIGNVYLISRPSHGERNIIYVGFCEQVTFEEASNLGIFPARIHEFYFLDTKQIITIPFMLKDGIYQNRNIRSI
jgi:hypothetical protein